MIIDNLTPISEWINNNEKSIRYWASTNQYKVTKNPGGGHHLTLQKKTPVSITKGATNKNCGKMFYNYGGEIKVKVTLQKPDGNFHAYEETDCDIIWWVRGSKVTMIDKAKLEDTNYFEYEDILMGKSLARFSRDDLFGHYYTEEEIQSVSNTVNFSETPNNFTYTSSFKNFKLVPRAVKQHSKGEVVTLTYDGKEFHATIQNWKTYSREHNNCKNIQLKRNGKLFDDAIHGSLTKRNNFKKVGKDGTWAFYTENENMRNWLYSYLNEKSVFLFLSSLFSIQVGTTCNIVNNVVKNNIYKENTINKDNTLFTKLQVHNELKQKVMAGNKQKRPHEQEWLELCESWGNDPEMCWSYEGYINQYYSAA
jgi:hypothetical protein